MSKYVVKAEFEYESNVELDNEAFESALDEWKNVLFIEIYRSTGIPVHITDIALEEY